MTDQELLARFETADLEDFRHADHVRVAWIYLERDGRERALEEMLDGIQRFAAAKGAHTKFHHTLTRAWLDLIDLARRQHPDVRSPQALIAACPLLGDSRAVGRFYSADLLGSDAARGAWIEPDRAPLTVGHHSPSPVETMSNPNPDPLVQFHEAVNRAASLGIDTTPAALATANASGRPSVRMVLLRGADERGFVFHTNYTSRKAREIDENPHAALCFHWPTIEEQIRIEGTVERLSADESDAYFASRPRGSQIGAWASAQSQILPARGVLEKQIDEIERRFDGQPVPRPPFWGGFRIKPDHIEFWYGRTSRLHDRIVYVRDGSSWRIERLYP